MFLAALGLPTAALPALPMTTLY